jgi:hypothetical protein
MPPRDPRECPALEVALPADDVDNGTWQALGEPREVLFGDGSWRQVTVIAWWADRHGRPVVQLQWSAQLTMWTGEYLADAERIREG